MITECATTANTCRNVAPPPRIAVKIASSRPSERRAQISGRNTSSDAPVVYGA